MDKEQKIKELLSDWIIIQKSLNDDSPEEILDEYDWLEDSITKLAYNIFLNEKETFN